MLPLDLSEVLKCAVSSDTISVLELRLLMKKFIEDGKDGKRCRYSEDNNLHKCLALRKKSVSTNVK